MITVVLGAKKSLPGWQEGFECFLWVWLQLITAFLLVHAIVVTIQIGRVVVADQVHHSRYSSGNNYADKKQIISLPCKPLVEKIGNLITP